MPSVPAPVPPFPRAQIHCPNARCGRVMGETDGQRLYLVSCTVNRLVTLHCIEPNCRGRHVWRPSPTESGDCSPS